MKNLKIQPIMTQLLQYNKRATSINDPPQYVKAVHNIQNSSNKIGAE